jgi:hypothetical protein
VWFADDGPLDDRIAEHKGAVMAVAAQESVRWNGS